MQRSNVPMLQHADFLIQFFFKLLANKIRGCFTFPTRNCFTTYNEYSAIHCFREKENSVIRRWWWWWVIVIILASFHESSFHSFLVPALSLRRTHIESVFQNFNSHNQSWINVFFMLKLCFVTFYKRKRKNLTYA